MTDSTRTRPCSSRTLNGGTSRRFKFGSGGENFVHRLDLWEEGVGMAVSVKSDVRGNVVCCRSRDQVTSSVDWNVRMCRTGLTSLDGSVSKPSRCVIFWLFFGSPALPSEPHPHTWNHQGDPLRSRVSARASAMRGGSYAASDRQPRSLLQRKPGGHVTLWGGRHCQIRAGCLGPSASGSHHVNDTIRAGVNYWGVRRYQLVVALPSEQSLFYGGFPAGSCQT